MISEVYGSLIKIQGRQNGYHNLEVEEGVVREVALQYQHEYKK
jgi:hypothetical protein